jgi:uncharacterized surface protein with fasciclin (FAS1) repeats
MKPVRKLLTAILVFSACLGLRAQTVVDIVVNSPDHNTLETAVLAAGLETTLSGTGPFTLFAPTDAAFDALPAGILDALLADPQGALTDVLLYHALDANVASGDLTNGQIATTINGDDIVVTISGGNVFINNALVTTADVAATNGVVHIIDVVLVPNETVVDVVVASPDHTTLETAVVASELAPALTDPFASFTLFAPTDAAFANLPTGVLDALLADPTGALADVLLYHAVDAEVFSGDLSNGQLATTINGDAVVVTISGSNVFINNTQVTVADIDVDNGVVHVIDAVLVPGETVVDVVVASPDHTTLETAVVASELAPALTDPFASFTLFAPTDAAFANLPTGVLDALLADPTGALADVLLYHVLGAEVQSGDLTNGQIATTVNGDDIIVTLSGGNVFINNAQVTVADIITDNGVVHVLDAVLVPGNTVLDVVVNSADHNTLETAVVAAELASTLSDPFGTFTVFAPTDAAFANLDPALLNDLLNDPTGALADVLLYHVLGAEVQSGDLTNGQIATTVNGDDIIVTLSGGNVFINNAQVTVADITTDNGVVHVLDAVLVPGNTVLDVIVNSADHNTLETAVVAAELASTLSDPFGTFTVFAPTDAAFANLDPALLNDLLNDPTGALADVLLYHVLGAEVQSGDLTNGQIATTVNGDDIIVTLSGGNVFINNAQVTVADITTDNGVVHVLDAVLVPGNTVLDVVVNSADHNTLETAVVAAELASTLSDPFGTFTVFAPTDAAFANLDPALLNDLLNDPTGALADVLLYHVLGAEVQSGDLTNGQIATTVNGDDIIVTLSGGNVFINNAQVTVADITTDNGVVHVLDAVLVPGETVVDVVVASPDHTTLETAVVASELAPALTDPFASFTLFAPTDAAFANLPTGVLDALLADPTGALADVLLYHTIDSEVFSGDLSNGLIATTINGDDVIVTISGSDVFINNAQVSVADIDVDNGVVHVIDAVLVPGETVVDVVVASPDHTTLETAVVASELAPALTDPFANFTVFAPTDDAFDNLPAGVLDDLLADPTGALADVLLYHTVDAEVFSGDLSNGQLATTINGDDVIVTISGSDVFINNAQVSVADIDVDNGVVHVIDAVLVPGETVVDVVVASPDHTTLETAVVASELAPALTDPFANFTVFAPTDDAFDNLPAGVLDDLLADPTGALADVLLYHTVDAEVFSGDLSNGQLATTINGDDVIVTISGSDVFINNAQVSVADIDVDNGVVHVIDAVLVPGETVVDVVVASPDHTTLETAVVASELVPALSDPFASFTVFAPTDDAFDNLPAGVLDDLLADPTGALADVLLFHVSGELFLSGDLTDGLAVSTLVGDDVTITNDGTVIFVNNAQVTVADLETDNGVVHVINAVISDETAARIPDATDISIQVFPNPTSEVVNVSLKENAFVQLIDLNGRSLKSWNMMAGTDQYELGNIPAGTYFLLFKIGDETVRQIISVQ